MPLFLLRTVHLPWVRSLRDLSCRPEERAVLVTKSRFAIISDDDCVTASQRSLPTKMQRRLSDVARKLQLIKKRGFNFKSDIHIFGIM